uniref:UPF0261 family protein n=1 Tax=Schlesneria paludicola TaxID=360056 RepID=A0A7C4QR49_9PLAN
MSVFLLGTLDTKGAEVAFVREQLAAAGLAVTVVDTGCLGEPLFPADISREEVFRAAGCDGSALQAARDRGQAVSAAAQGAAKIVAEAWARGELAGVLSLGGSAGTAIGTTAMRALPFGVPKLMVSTLASGQTRPYVGGKDVLMMNAVVDIAGINRISRMVLGNAAAAMIGMVRARSAQQASAAATDRPLIAATMFGVTTPCVQTARAVLEAAGYEVLVFHATGNGGEAMEGLIADGLIAGVLDITTTELADELVGGILSAGPARLTAAGKRGIPQVISVGALDMVNFGPLGTVPDKFRGRTFYQHNPAVTLMRTTVAENRALGEEIGRKAAAALGPTVIFLPRRGVSAIDAQGQPFDDPLAREALFAGIRATCGQTEVIELDRHINDTEFATACAERLLALLR